MAPGDAYAHLHAFPLFQTLDEDRLRALAVLTNLRKFEQGKPLFHYRDPGDALYFLCRGRVRFERPDSTGKPVELETVGPGHMFGEVAVLFKEDPRAPSGLRTASAFAAEDVQVLELRRDDLRAFLALDHEFALALMGEMARRLHRSGYQVRSVRATLEKNETRLERFVHGVARQFGRGWFMAAVGVAIAAWVAANMGMGDGAFDPYPYNLLGLALSVVAFYVASIVLNSQTREEDAAAVRDDAAFETTQRIEEEIHFFRVELERLRAELRRPDSQP